MANEMLDTIVNIQPKDSSGSGGETRESVVYKLADDMLSKLPEDYIPHEVSFYMSWKRSLVRLVKYMKYLRKNCVENVEMVLNLYTFMICI